MTLMDPNSPMARYLDSCTQDADGNLIDPDTGQVAAHKKKANESIDSFLARTMPSQGLHDMVQQATADPLMADFQSALRAEFEERLKSSRDFDRRYFRLTREEGRIAAFRRETLDPPNDEEAGT